MRSELFTFLFMSAACGGSGDGGEPAPDAAPRQVVTETRQLLVGELAEATLTGGPTDVAELSFTAPAARLDWNIHGHAGGSTQTVKEALGVMAASYTFVPSAQADWFLLLRNQGTAPLAVELRLALYGNMQWSGFR